MIRQKQPKGMYILAFTEIFERLSYYTLAFLLVLYASGSLANGGLGWSKEKALALVGIYSMAAYTLPIVSTFITDSFIGRYRSAVFGGIVIVLGHFCMLFSAHVPMFYLALALVASGTSFFKPCMPALLGALYTPDDTRRESGFSWYYVGINVGGFVAGISSGLLMQRYGYHIALASAGVGMIFGLIVFYLGRHHLVYENVVKATGAKKVSAPVSQMSAVQKKAVGYLGIAFVFFAMWAIVYNVALTGTLSLYIENYTNRNFFSYEIPTNFFMSLESLTILVATPVLTTVLSYMASKKKYPHFFSLMNLAVVLSALAMLYFSYLAHIGQSAAQGTKPFEWIEIAFFIVVIAVSETIISPVMMSAISLLAPDKYKAFFQSFYLACFGLTSLVAARIGAISLGKPFETFLTLGIVISVGALFYFLVKGKMIETAREAAIESSRNHQNSQENRAVTV